MALGTEVLRFRVLVVAHVAVEFGPVVGRRVRVLRLHFLCPLRQLIRVVAGRTLFHLHSFDLLGLSVTLDAGYPAELMKMTTRHYTFQARSPRLCVTFLAGLKGHSLCVFMTLGKDLLATVTGHAVTRFCGGYSLGCGGGRTRAPNYKEGNQPQGEKRSPETLTPCQGIYPFLFLYHREPPGQIISHVPQASLVRNPLSTNKGKEVTVPPPLSRIAIG